MVTETNLVSIISPASSVVFFLFSLGLPLIVGFARKKNVDLTMRSSVD